MDNEYCKDLFDKLLRAGGKYTENQLFDGKQMIVENAILIKKKSG